LLDISLKNHFNGLFKWPRDTHVSPLQVKNFTNDDGSLQKCGDSFSQMLCIALERQRV